MVLVWSFNGMVLVWYGWGHYLDFGMGFGLIFCPRICLGLVSNLSGPSLGHGLDLHTILGHGGSGLVSLSMLNNYKTGLIQIWLSQKLNSLHYTKP